MKSLNTLSDRLLFVMKQRNIKQADLMRATGASRPAVHGWVSGNTKNLKGENLVRAAHYLNVNTDWLAYGQGEMEASWPLKRVSLTDLQSLSPHYLDDIEDYILMKINKYYALRGSNK